MQQDINSLCRLFDSNKLSISRTKSCGMFIGSQQKITKFENLESLRLFIEDTPLAFKHSYKYLGLEIDSKLSWSDSINSITKKLRSQLAALQRICSIIPLSILTIFIIPSNNHISTTVSIKSSAFKIVLQEF